MVVSLRSLVVWDDPSATNWELMKGAADWNPHDDMPIIPGKGSSQFEDVRVAEKGNSSMIYHFVGITGILTSTE